MLEQLARHSLIDLEIKANGDTHIDDHHTVEDTGIALGQALTEAMVTKKGLIDTVGAYCRWMTPLYRTALIYLPVLFIF